jgi:hypothetical protein
MIPWSLESSAAQVSQVHAYSADNIVPLAMAAMF